MKWITGLVAFVGLATGAYVYLALQPHESFTSGGPIGSAVSGSRHAPPSPVSSEIPKPTSPLAAATDTPSPVRRVQTSTDLFALFNELKGAQLGGDKQTAAARYAAFLALEECSPYIKPEMFKPVLEHIRSLPDSDPNKILRLKAYEFDMTRCAGFAGWTLEQMTAEKTALVDEAAKLGSRAAQVRQAHHRYADRGRKPEERLALIEAIAKTPPDEGGVVLNEASRFIGRFLDYRYRSRSSGQQYSRDMVELALYSLGCQYDGMCAATKGTNSQSCWMYDKCDVLAPDQYIADERLTPAQYKRFLVLRQELQTSISQGQWPGGFWDNLLLAPVTVGTAAIW